MENLSCPSCAGTKLARYGKTAAGLQKYRCLDGSGIGCRRQFVAGSSHLIEPDKLTRIGALLKQSTSPKKIKAAFPEISMRWIYELRRRSR